MCVKEDEGHLNKKPLAVAKRKREQSLNYIYCENCLKMMRLSLPVLLLAPYQKCHNSSGLTFLILLVISYTVKAGGNTNVNSGERIAIN